MKKMLFMVIALSMLLPGCSKSKGDGNAIVTPMTQDPDPLQAFEYTDGLICNRTSPFVYDGISMDLFFGLRYNKIWLGIAEKVGDKFIARYEWTGGDELDETITVDLPYGEQKNYNLDGISATYGVKGIGAKFAFTVNIAYDYPPPYIISKLIIDDNGVIQIVDLEINHTFKVREWTDDYFVAYYNGTSTSYPGAGGCYSYAGEEKYKFASYFDFSNNLKFYSLISIEDGIVINQASQSRPRCRRLNFNTGESLWGKSIVFSDVPTDARYDSWQVDAKEGNIWTISANITLYSGEKEARSFRLNIDTGEVNYI